MDDKSGCESPNTSKKRTTCQSESLPSACGTDERPSNGTGAATSVNDAESNGHMNGKSSSRSSESPGNCNGGDPPSGNGATSSSTSSSSPANAGPSAVANIANGNDSSGRVKASTDPDNWLAHDPTPYHNSYPAPKWFSVRQLLQREYGRSLVPKEGRSNRPKSHLFDPVSFRRNAYSSLYFVQKLQCKITLNEHRGCVNCLNFNSNGELLVSGSDDRKINIWNWQQEKVVERYFTGHTQNVFQCKFINNESQVVTASRDGQVRLITRNGCINRDSKCSKKLASHADAIHRIKITSPTTLLSCGEDSIVQQIDLRQPKPMKILQVKHSSKRIPLFTIDTSPLLNPYLISVGGRDPHVFLYDKRFIVTASESPAPLDVIIPYGLEKTDHIVTGALFDSIGKSLLISYNDDDIYLVDVESKTVQHTYRGHRNALTLKGCSWFTDDFIVSGSDDGYFYAWHRDTEHIVMSLHGDVAGVVNCIEPHPVNPFLATSGLDHDIKIWAPTSDTWPVTMKGIKKRICDNIRTRESEREESASDSDLNDNRLFLSLIQRLNRTPLVNVTGELDDSDDSSGDNEDDDAAASDEDREEDSDADGREESETSRLRTRAIRNQVLEAIFSTSGARIVVRPGATGGDEGDDADDQGNSCVTS